MSRKVDEMNTRIGIGPHSRHGKAGSASASRSALRSAEVEPTKTRNVRVPVSMGYCEDNSAFLSAMSAWQLTDIDHTRPHTENRFPQTPRPRDDLRGAAATARRQAVPHGYQYIRMLHDVAAGLFVGLCAAVPR